jgi:hypothetical protein
MEFDREAEAGWHVVLGSNGAGKSSVVRAFALLCMGDKEAYASRQDFSRWVQYGRDSAKVSGTFTINRDYDVLSGGGQPPQKLISVSVQLDRDEWDGDAIEITYSGERHTRTIYGGGAGWFSASFGPFRRFTGGDRVYDRLFFSNRRLATHLSALGEDVALTEALGWLSSLHVQSLQDEKSNRRSTSGEILTNVVKFINDSDFLPHGAKIQVITNTDVLVLDGNRNLISLEVLSDGYRSALSFVIELVRQMFEIYGADVMLASFSPDTGAILAPGVVAIDEIDAHLHPTWQHKIGKWLTRFFPCIQFIVTTHSPIVCRAVVNEDGQVAGSIWQLPIPGSGDRPRRIRGDDLDQLLFGDVLDAYGTELFGQDVSRSEAGSDLLTELASLNRKELDDGLSSEERERQLTLRGLFPTLASDV